MQETSSRKVKRRARDRKHATEKCRSMYKPWKARAASKAAHDTKGNTEFKKAVAVKFLEQRVLCVTATVDGSSAFASTSHLAVPLSLMESQQPKKKKKERKQCTI